jgi:hypothetical protein
MAMPVLNRFPLLGLWAKEAARRLGYTEGEAESLGHAYAVLYAIRARGKPPPSGEPGKKKKPAKKPAHKEQLHFAGDTLDVTHDAKGKVRGRVGGEKPQTPETYRASIQQKFPDGYYVKLEGCFRKLFKSYPPRRLDGRLVYDLYDTWKKSCGVGRMVDLGELVRWCQHETAAQEAT